MTLRPVDKEKQPTDAPPDAIQECPVCQGRMETVYDRHHQTVCVCVDCHTGVTVPATAWNIARLKGQNKSA